MLARKDQSVDNLEKWKIMTAGAIGGLMFWGPWVTQKAEFPTKFS